MNICTFLAKKIQQALLKTGLNYKFDIKVRRSPIRNNFGDYQSNSIILIAKKNGIPPYKLAEQVVSNIRIENIIYKIEVMNPGFINFFLRKDWLSKQLQKNFNIPNFGIRKEKSETIIIDYSSPNIAKDMHVGHLRSTIIGDVSVRILKFLGHNVIKANHIGDWGTQLGILIAYFKKSKEKFNKNKIFFENLSKFYPSAKKIYDKDKKFADCARNCVLQLQQGDEYHRMIWKNIVNFSISKNQKIYNLLDVKLKIDDVIGESFYNEMLPRIVKDLTYKGLAVKSEGATVVFIDNFKNKKGKPFGAIIQKKDGAYLYITTDIACFKYRCKKLKAKRIIYYVDSRQYQHLVQACFIARKAGYIPDSVSIEYHIFGMILKENGKPFKTRSGEIVKLEDLIYESIERARNFLLSKNPNLNNLKIDNLAKIIGIGSIKYFDLSKNRTNNYIFNWENILNLEGNTMLYIQYAFVRINSILKKSKNLKIKNEEFILLEDQEIKLAICILQFEEILLKVASNGTPHLLCGYLYNLATLFSYFYETCPILKIENKEIQISRLKISLLTARILKKGMYFLGIKIVDYM